MTVTLDTIKQLNNGAKFYTADLHIHTYEGSADVSDETMTAESIIETALEDKLDVIAITDHNNDRNIAAALDYADRYTGRLLVVPGVEVTTANGHLLVYFDPAKPDRLNDLLSKIDLVGDRGGKQTHTAMSMAQVIKQADQLGGICVAAHIDREKTGFEMLSEGYPNWKKDIITSPGLYGLEFDDAAHFGWYSPDDSSAAGAERRKLLGGRSKVVTLQGRTELACIQGSDAHTLERFKNQHEGRSLTRFKMTELSFEGLRTAFVDPEARVRAVAELPKFFPRIVGLHTEGGFLDNSTIRFSSNLNCLIGGRGTGKSTTLESLAHCLGVTSEFEDKGSCPERTIVYCEDGDGIPYQYVRTRHSEPSVRAREDGTITDVPADAFKVEFYSQGQLGEVAKDPLRNPELLQEFLDRHLDLSTLKGRETSLLDQLERNSSALLPLENSAAQLRPKETTLKELKKKVEVAEQGRLKELVTFRSRVAAEKELAALCKSTSDVYRQGISLRELTRNFDDLLESVSRTTGDDESEKALAEVRAIVEKVNGFATTKEREINQALQDSAGELDTALEALYERHRYFDEQIAAKVSDFQRQGLTADTRALDEILRQRGLITREIDKIKQQGQQLVEFRQERSGLLQELEEVRAEMLRRRRDATRAINTQLKSSISDYHIFLYYDNEGMIDSYKSVVLDVMHGSHYQDETAKDLCRTTSPQQLASLVAEEDLEGLADAVGAGWEQTFYDRFRMLKSRYRLEVTSKPAKPIIKVLTKTDSQEEIPVTELSDGQKHTILLTIAMLAESPLPLVIDQPEDDLDNAFIFSSVVKTLRSVKERRQVILVTHNANIAVLGDSELIMPMRRSGNIGEVFERGSIDRTETRQAVQDILEGGEIAFRKRKEIYGH